MLREVNLTRTPGRLFLMGMPGRYAPYESDLTALQVETIDLLISLAERSEIARKSPAYAAALAEDRFPLPRREHPLPDYGVPDDRALFLELAQELAEMLRNGQRLAIHCGAGIGRTGTLAAVVLLALGWSQAEALAQVHEAGSGPETAGQFALVDWAAQAL